MGNQIGGEGRSNFGTIGGIINALYETNKRLREAVSELRCAFKNSSNSASSYPVAKKANSINLVTSNTVMQAFPATPCNALDIVNNSGVDICYLRDGDFVPIVIPTGGSRLVVGITNASQVSARNLGAFSQLELTAEAITF